MSSLRSELTEITNDLDVATHENRIQAIAKEFPHSIQAVPYDEDHCRYNCFMYALDLVGAFVEPCTFVGNKFLLDVSVR